MKKQQNQKIVTKKMLDELLAKRKIAHEAFTNINREIPSINTNVVNMNGFIGVEKITDNGQCLTRIHMSALDRNTNGVLAWVSWQKIVIEDGHFVVECID